MTSSDNTDVTDDASPVDAEGAAPEITESEATELDQPQSEATEPADKKDAQSAPKASVTRGVASGVRAQLGVILLAAALVASAGVAAWLYFSQYRPDQATNPAAAKVALDAATNGTVALLSYSPESLDKDFAAAKSHLTGDFLSYYTQFTQQIVTPAAQQKSVKTTASVVRSALAEIHPDSAVALVFINQTTTSKENPDGAFAASAVKVGMKKIDGTWLISSFDPV